MDDQPEVYVTIFHADGDDETWWFNADRVTFESDLDDRVPFTLTIKAEDYGFINYSHGGHS